jgi:hypothetical protein
VVTYNDHQIQYHPVGPDTGWRIDNPSRCVVIGTMPRTYIPLDQVRYFSIEHVGPADGAAPDNIRQKTPVAHFGCDDCSVEPGERHRHPACPGARQERKEESCSTQP